jgi:signal transduction histidine kinase
MRRASLFSGGAIRLRLKIRPVHDPLGRAFSRTLTITLVLFALFTAGAVLVFGHLLFKTLSKDVMDEAILASRLDAERIARGLAEHSGGNLYTLKTRQTEIDTLIANTVTERKVLNEIRVLDSTGRVVYEFRSSLKRPATVENRGVEGMEVVPKAGSGAAFETAPKMFETEIPLIDPFQIEVPIGNFGTLSVGMSRRELESRVETLRKKLYLRTFLAAAISLLGIGAASAAVILLYRRNQRIEEARIEAERRAELGEVAAGLAHEIRNPLNAMSLNLELLEEQLQRVKTASVSPGLVIADLAQATRQETDRLSRMLTDFLAYARPSPLQLVPYDLNEPASEAVSFLRPEADRRGIRLVCNPAPRPAMARLDPQRVKQIVLNLVGNALDAVEAEGARSREVDVKIEDAQDHWRLVVTDAGPGLPPSKLGDIFKVFVSTKPAGTGLGLPIAQRIVKGHGGALTLTSPEGGPTTAVATFPKIKG